MRDKAREKQREKDKRKRERERERETNSATEYFKGFVVQRQTWTCQTLLAVDDLYIHHISQFEQLLKTSQMQHFIRQLLSSTLLNPSKFQKNNVPHLK